KLLSFAFAIMLWSYVISSNQAITRTKTINDLTGYVSGQATLDVYGLALLTDTTEALRDISVQVDVPLANYSQVTAESVQVVLDVSSVRTAGTQAVPLKATTSHGSVANIYPSSLTLTFETLDARAIPVNVLLSGGEDEAYWHNVSRINPQQITVTGATSLVQSVNYAIVNCDVAGRAESFTTAQTFILVDGTGAEVAQTMLNRSASSITVGVDVYPTKDIEISAAVDDILLGQVAPGYQIESISVQPESVTVAADPELLGAIDKLIIQPIEIDAPSQSFTKRATIAGLTDFKYISSEQVYVTVQIAEETANAWIEDVYVSFLGINKDEFTLTWDRNTIAVHVTGPKSKIEQLMVEGMTATADLAGLGAGEHEVAIYVDEANYPDIVFELESDTVRVTLEPRAADE
ncbi:MAG: YbbR-like domain-containing protein, partial [Christensenellales bacterium]